MSSIRSIYVVSNRDLLLFQGGYWILIDILPILTGFAYKSVTYQKACIY